MSEQASQLSLDELFPDMPLPQVEEELTVGHVLNAMKSQKSLRVSPEHYRGRAVAREQDGKCYWCNGTIDAKSTNVATKVHVDHLIRPNAGGTNHSFNLVGSCRKCNLRKFTHDPKAWCAKSEIKSTRRKKALLTSMNHLTLFIPSSRQQVDKELAKRYEHMRFTVSAFCSQTEGWFGWARADDVPNELVFALKYMGGVLTDEKRWSVIRIPRDRFLDAAWMLIECNAYIRKLTLNGFKDATPTDNFERARWSETFTNANDLVRRRHVLARKYLRPIAAHS